MLEVADMMNIVLTTVFEPREGPRAIAAGLEGGKGVLWAIGDHKGPCRFELPNTHFISLEEQFKLDLSIISLLPVKHYTRKNIGYLLAMRNGAEYVVETDDDNVPLSSFWNIRAPVVHGDIVECKPWFNVYTLFCKARIWPRGLPLEFVRKSFGRDASLLDGSVQCFIQQGLVNGDPDIDAVQRLTQDGFGDFTARRPVILEQGVWCPFNSQNTTTFRPAFPLLYLPSYCSFRMTDIWRSFVAQRCLWAMGSHLAFTMPTVFQDRNDHELLRDFEQEIPGYLLNDKIRCLLEAVQLEQGEQADIVCQNLTRCYEVLIDAGIVDPRERAIVCAWCHDVLSLLGSI